MANLSKYNYPNDPSKHTPYPKYVHKRNPDGSIVIDSSDPFGKKALESRIVNDPEEEAAVEAELNPKPAKAAKSSSTDEPNIPPFPSSQQTAPPANWKPAK